MLILYEKYKIDPTYLLTGEKNHTFDVELFLANCSREERDEFIDRIYSSICITAVLMLIGKVQLLLQVHIE